MHGRVFAVSLFLLAGCKTYHITPESLREQLQGTEPTVVRTQGPVFEVHTYKANGIRMIHCTDKEGRPVELPNGPSIEARITMRSGKRNTMYFDRIELRNDTLLGHPSRFAPTLEVRIPFSDIVKVEVQNGGKRFGYTD